MGDLFKSKKFLSAVVGAVITILVMIITGLLEKVGAKVDEATVAQGLWTVAGLFGVQIAGQAAADYGSQGLTSSNGKTITEAMGKNSQAPSGP